MENEEINNLTSPPRSRSLCSGLLFSTASSTSDIAGGQQQNITRLTAIPSLDFYLFTSPSSALIGSEEVGECEQLQSSR